jgi:hypothetical protein
MLEEFLNTIAEVCERYGPQMRAARQSPKKDPDGKPYIN